MSMREIRFIGTSVRRDSRIQIQSITMCTEDVRMYMQECVLPGARAMLMVVVLIPVVILVAAGVLSFMTRVIPPSVMSAMLWLAL